MMIFFLLNIFLKFNIKNEPLNESVNRSVNERHLNEYLRRRIVINMNHCLNKILIEKKNGQRNRRRRLNHYLFS